MKIMVNLEGTNDYKELDVKESLSILELKSKISSLFNIPIKEIELILNDIALEDDSFLDEINFEDNVILLRRHKLNLPQNNLLLEPHNQNQNNNVLLFENNKIFIKVLTIKLINYLQLFLFSSSSINDSSWILSKEHSFAFFNCRCKYVYSSVFLNKLNFCSDKILSSEF